jgi:methyl-accepting chemotaxis protein
MLNRVTVNALLKSVVVAMAVTIVVMLSMGALSSWKRLKGVNQIAEVTNASAYLFTGLHNLGLDRSATFRELLADRVSAELHPQIRESRAAETPALLALVPALAAIDFPEKDTTIAELDRSIKNLTSLQEQSISDLKQPKSARRSSLSQDYFKQANALIDSLEKLSARLVRLVKLEDAFIDQLLELKQHAWTIRNAGGTSSVLISNTLSGQPLPPDALNRYTTQVAKMETAWAAFEDMAAGLPLPDKFQAAVDVVRKDFFGSYFPEFRANTFKAVLAGEKPMTVDQWTAIAVPRNALPVGIAAAILDVAKEYGADQRAKALSGLIIEIVLLIAALTITAATMVIISRRVTGPLRTIREAMLKVATGDFDVTLPGLERKDEIGDVANAVERFKVLAVEKARQQADEALKRQQTESEQQAQAAKTEAERTSQAAQAEADRQARAAEAEAAVQAQAAAERAKIAEEQAQAVRALGAGLQNLADGDLTYRLADEFPDAYRQIKDDFNATMARLEETLQSLVTSTREVTSAAAEISTSTTDLSQRTEEQAASLEETSASMEQISVTVKKNAENAQQANQLTAGTRQVADRSGEVVASTVEAMSRIEESSRKIADIIGVIDEIARQTNLLALNAAVEAARAGDAGRGFAVVASEVRSLAQRSSQAAKDIKDLITSSSTQVQEGVDLVNRTGTSLNEIVGSIKKVADIVADIATASIEQSTGLDQISKALTQMDDATQQNSALVEENAATAKTLEQQASAMTEQVSFFRIAGGTAKIVSMPSAAARAQTKSSAATAAKPTPAAKRGGMVNRMQSARATALNRNPEWKDF